MAQPKHKKEILRPDVKIRKISNWSKVGENVSILLSNVRVSRLTPLLAERDSKVAPEMCIAAPIYCQTHENYQNDWTPYILDKIKEIGYELHLKNKIVFKMETSKAIRIRPNAIYPKFIVDNNKIEVLINNIYDSGGTDVINNIDISKLENLIKENNSIILSTENKRFVSFWYTTNALTHQNQPLYVCYSPPQGFGKNLEYSFILQSKNFQNLFLYLKHNIHFEGTYELFSSQILNKEPIILCLDEIFQERENRIMKKITNTDTEIIGNEDMILEENEKNVIVPGESITMNDIDRSNDSYRISFSEDYANNYYSDRGFLSGSIGMYVKDPNKIIITNIAAAIYLHHIRAANWNKQTINDILGFGEILFKESIDRGIANDVYWIQRIPQPINFHTKKYQLIFEKIIIGDIQTEENFIFSIRQGICAFFKNSDLGIIYGPQPQLIWQEAGLYFTFSPKERDSIGRKWNPLLATQLDKNNENPSDLLQQNGSACVSWFKDITCLCDSYLTNIALKHRKDQYRIVKIKINELEEISESYKNWKSYAPGKWRIIGDKSICNYIENSEAGSNLNEIFVKSFAIACVNSLYAKIYDSNEWDSKNIDEILNYGNDYYKESINEQPELKVEFNFTNLKKTFVLRDNRFKIVIAANKYQGQVLYSKKNTPNLARALKLYFDDYQYGLILIGDRIIPIFQMNSYYHLLFVYDKIFGKTDVCVCSSENIYGEVYGHAFALRFKDLSIMYEEILNIMNINNDEKYSLYIVEGKDRPPLMNYKQFGDNAAILHPYNNLHEGSSIFNVRADKQTYANILVTLCYVNISRPLEWSPEDITDLLTTGDSIYCRLTANLKNCLELFFELKLEDITPYIGLNKFQLKIIPYSGVFKIYPKNNKEDIENNQIDENDDDDNDDDDDDVDVEIEDVNNEKNLLSTLNQLSEILSEWENEEQILGILDSNVIKLGLWKKDLVYFVFDPKASLTNGQMTERRIERAKISIESNSDSDIITDLRHIDNNGSAYCAYFYDLQSYIEHLLSCISKEYHSEKFTFNKLQITCLPILKTELDTKFYLKSNFIITTPHISIIRSTISQDEIMFKNRNKQEISNCMIAIAFAYITSPNDWTSELLNIILKYGDRLYVKSLNYLKKYNNEKFHKIELEKELITIEDIVKTINIYKIKFKFIILKKISNCINSDVELNKNIKRIFNRLENIENGFGAIINIKNRMNSIWKQNGVFFLFDPFKCDPTGLIAATIGTACLLRFNKFELFIEFFIKKYMCKDGANNFELILISCEKSMPSSIPGFYMDKYNFTLQRPANQLIFEEIENDMQIMKRTVDISSKSSKFVCLAALLYSRIEYVELWNFTIFEKIILLAEFLQQQLDCKTNTTNNNHLEDINFSVIIDTILCNIVVNHIVQVTPQTEIESKNLNMHQGLQSFFLQHSNCIITSSYNRKCYAIWNEGPNYYMIWYREYDSKLILLVSSNWLNFYKIILDEIENDIAPIYFIKKVIITRIKMSDSCKTNLTSRTESEDFNEKCRKCNFSNFMENYISKNMIKAQINGNFIEYSQGINILFGDLIKTNELFSNDVLFCESLKACCLIAAATSIIFSPELWQKDTLKQIISIGIDLLKSNIALLRKIEFEITDYPNNMNLFNYNVSVTVEQPTIEDFDINSLLNLLKYIIRNNQIAYIGIEKQFYMTIMMDEQNYYLFYPGSSYIPENMDSEATYLLKADTILQLIKFIVKKYKTTDDSVRVGVINAQFLQ